MNIAIFHNFMDNIGGAEVLLLHLARGLNADIYTTNIDPEKIKLMGFEDILPRIKSIGKVPVNAPFRQQLSLWRFRRLNLGKQYDFYIIGGDWAMSGAVNNKPNMWYTHSPLHELWEYRQHIRQELLAPIKRPLYDIFVWFNRFLTLRYAKHVGTWICNSKTVQARTQKYYKRTPVVIYPPIDTGKAQYLPHKNYWIAVNRLLFQKRIDIQLKAFKLLPEEKLIIVGSYEKGANQFEIYKKLLEDMKPDNVEILNFVDSKDLEKLYAESKGFIATSRKEDFGMAILEGMSHGKPVIAPNEGGYRESVTPEVGILIDDIDEHKLAAAVRDLSPKVESYKDACIARAKEFDLDIFVNKIRQAINSSTTLS